MDNKTKAVIAMTIAVAVVPSVINLAFKVGKKIGRKDALDEIVVDAV